MNASSRHFCTVPACLAKLRDRPRWVGWRWETRRNKTGEEVPTKPPFQVNGAYAHNDKPETWASLDEIEAVMQVHRFDGVGLQLLNLQGLAALDLDDVRDLKTGAVLYPWVSEVLGCGSYAEVTPSGTGFRVLGRVAKDHRPMHVKKTHPGGGEIEFYVNTDTGRYITVSGDRVDGAPDEVIDLTEIVAGLWGLVTAEESTKRKAEEQKTWDFNEDAEIREFGDLPAWLQDLIAHGRTEDRSGDFQAAVNALYVRVNFETALRFFEGYPDGPAAKYQSRLERELRRSWTAAAATSSSHREDGKSSAESAGDERATPKVSPTRFVLRPAHTIPPREWLYGRHLIRGYVSTTVSPGGLGKSSSACVEALAMVAGKPLLGELPACPLRVWMWNGEDPHLELERRITAACLHYRLTNDDLRNRLSMDSGRDLPIRLATMGRNGVQVARPLGDALIAALKAARTDVLVIDPFVSSHEVSENDNTAINAVVAEWRRIASLANCAIELIHHVSKAGAVSDDLGIYGARGAGALIDAVRSARYLVRMKPEEAERFGLEVPDGYYRVVMGKANLAPADKAVWRRLVSVPLGNGSGLWPQGDLIGVSTPWTPPDAFEGMTLNDLARVQAAINRCEEPPAYNERASDWVGYVIADVLGFDIGEGRKAERMPSQNIARAKVRQLLSGWLKSGALVIETIRNSRQSRDVKVVRVGEPAGETGE